MTLFPLVRPCLGLSMTAHSVCLVEFRRKWQGRQFCRLGQYPLPTGLVQLTPGKPNITDLKAFTNCLQVLVKDIKGPQPVALSLPDICARTAVFEFSSFPKKEIERDAIIRWRFQQDLNLSTEKARLAYRLYQSSPSPKKSRSSTSSLVQLLATVVQHDIVEQYEQACLSAGLLPVSVGMASLDIFDFYRSTMQKVLGETISRKSVLGTEAVFLYLTEWGFCFIALREGCPIFVRVKALRLPRLSGQTMNSGSSQEGGSVDDQSRAEEPIQAAISADSSQMNGLEVGGHDPSVGTLAITNELVATLQYYFESARLDSWKNKVLTLFFAEGVEQGRTFLPPVEQVEDKLLASMPEPPPINIISLPNKVSTVSSEMKAPSNGFHRLALPAFASVMVT